MSNSFISSILKSIDLILIKLDSIEHRMTELCEKIDIVANKNVLLSEDIQTNSKDS